MPEHEIRQNPSGSFLEVPTVNRCPCCPAREIVNHGVINDAVFCECPCCGAHFEVACVWRCPVLEDEDDA